jgi:hypothetical protein
MTKHQSMDLTDLVPTAVKIPRALLDRIEELAHFVRGGKSEVIRRAITAGLPVVIAQRARDFGARIQCDAQRGGIVLPVSKTEGAYKWNQTK